MEELHNNHNMSRRNTKNTPPESPIEDVEQSKKTAEKVDGIFYTFDRAVDWLIEQGKQGNNVYIDWNETLLYSYEIKTRDDAYMIYYGITELERKKKIEELQRQREAEALRRKLELLDWRDNLGDTWKKYIPKALWKRWEKDLKTDDEYKLMDMKIELEKFMKENPDNCRNIST